MLGLLVTAFVLGLAGSLHCVGMCGPLVMSMPFQIVSHNNKITAVILYMVAKAFAYGLMGLLVGLIGSGFVLMVQQQYLSIIAGIIILIFAIAPTVLKKISLPQYIQKKFTSIYATIIQSPKLIYFPILGFINGLLPCGLVYTALAAATTTALAFNGFMFMFLFGIGTMPTLISVVLLKNGLAFNIRKKLSKVSFIFSLLLGMLLVLRGMNLDIPYISPSIHNGEVQSCCHKPS